MIQTFLQITQGIKFYSARAIYSLGFLLIKSSFVFDFLRVIILWFDGHKLVD